MTSTNIFELSRLHELAPNCECRIWRTLEILVFLNVAHMRETVTQIIAGNCNTGGKIQVFSNVGSARKQQDKNNLILLSIFPALQTVLIIIRRKHENDT